MNTRLQNLILITCMFLAACASDTSSDNTVAESAETASDQQVQASPVIPEPIDTGVYLSEGTFDGFLLGDWTFDISIDVLEDAANKTRRGNIITFKPDFTYQVAQNGSIIEKGKFEYNRTREFLVLKPAEGNPTEWKVSMMGNSLVWQSTERYKNKGTQVRLYQGIVELED